MAHKAGEATTLCNRAVESVVHSTWIDPDHPMSCKACLRKDAERKAKDMTIEQSEAFADSLKLTPFVSGHYRVHGLRNKRGEDVFVGLRRHRGEWMATVRTSGIHGEDRAVEFGSTRKEALRMAVWMQKLHKREGAA